MAIYEELKQYAADCISGKIVSCRKHKWACMRFLRDTRRIDQESFPFYWSEEAAQNIVDWFALLRHSKGVPAGKPIYLTLWQNLS